MALRWIEDHATVVNQATKRGLLQALAISITANGSDTNWTLSYPSSLSAIENVFTLTHVTGDKTVYVEFARPLKFTDTDGTEKNNYHFMEVRFGTDYTAPTGDGLDAIGTWGDDAGSVRTRFSWFKTNTKANIKGWLPVKYWISATSESLAIILEGSPSANAYDRLISFGYVGQLETFVEDVNTSAGSNFGICCSSDISAFDYLTDTEINQFSDNTGTGVTDITMIETSDGFPMQSHLISLTTPDEFTNRSIEGPSAYTQKYHMTYIYVFHNFDGYRGRLKNAIAYDRNTVINQDNLRHKYIKESDPTKPEVIDRYKVFLVNAPYSIFNNADNILYGVALLQETNYDVSLHLEPGALELEELGSDTFNAIFENATTGTKYNATNEATWTINKHDTNIKIDKGLVSNTTTPGNYEVTATYNGYTATGIVKIREPYPTALEVTPSTANIWQGGTTTFKVMVTMSNGVKFDVTDVSDVILPDEPNTGTSINDGVISNATVPGTYKINATYKNLTASATLEVKELTVSSVSVTPSTKTLEQGDPATFIGTATMSDGTTRDLADIGTWTITGTGTDITISKGVIANDQTPGTYTVTVAFHDKSATATLTVKEKFVPYITISPSSRDILLGTDTSFTAKYYSAPSTSTSITSTATWSLSGGGGISGGKVTGTTPGTYIVTCEYNGATAKAELKVHDFTYQAIIDWPADGDTDNNNNDWDLHAQAYTSGGTKVGDEVYFSSKKSVADDGSWGIWLDRDAQDSGTEIISVDGMPGDYIIFTMEMYTDNCQFPVNCRVVNKSGSTLGSKTVSNATYKEDPKTVVQLFKLDLGTGTVTVL